MQNSYQSEKYCISAVETNRKMLLLLQKARSKAINNQLHGVLFYQKNAFRPVANMYYGLAYKKYRENYYADPLKLCAGNWTWTGMRLQDKLGRI